MPQFLLDLIQQLEPVIGLLVIILIIAVVYLWRNILDKDKRLKEKDMEIERLRGEMNNTVRTKDVDLKDVNNKVIQLQEKSISSTNNLVSVITKLSDEIKHRAELDTVRTDAIVKTLEGIQTVLLNIKK